MKIIRTKSAALNTGYDKELKSQLVQHLEILIKQIQSGQLELPDAADALNDLSEGTHVDMSAERQVRTEQEQPIGII
jgi:hypothetical protein|tara:strand:- start:211 stop:441 length:231 start_codon:yes stop_codon:yes gene_type:complete